jgi:hypothetical protein
VVEFGGIHCQQLLISVHCPCVMQAERERQFEMELRRVKGLEVRHMVEDGNCLFRAVTHLVYGDAEMYDEIRQMCIDYMVGTPPDCCYL